MIASRSTAVSRSTASSGGLPAGTYYVAVVPYEGAQTSYALSIETGATSTSPAPPPPPWPMPESLALRDSTGLGMGGAASTPFGHVARRDARGPAAGGGLIADRQLRSLAPAGPPRVGRRTGSRLQFPLVSGWLEGRARSRRHAR